MFDLNKIDILSLTYEELESILIEIGEPKFRAKQVFSWLHEKQVTSFSDMTTLSLKLRECLNEKFYINRLQVERRLASSIDDTVKYLYKLSDGNYIETVCMSYNHGRSLCISTQVGCKMGCQFCASAIAGFIRNLTPSEMLLQVYETQRNENCKISSIVLMGIGEPLDNFDNVMRFLKLLSDSRGMQMSLRHVSLSTCGIVPKIKELAEYKLGLTLSVSLHCPYDEERSKIMPVNKKYPISELLDACRFYEEHTGRRVTFEYAVIENLNSTSKAAQALAKLLKGMNCHVNLIPVNPVKERNYRTIKKTVIQFQKELEQLGINATIRRTLGSDIEAACGQLRRDALSKKA
ncbi:MAG: 23S rRNA (adenine(2503)-C(2))-methyltransferase RlmN [Ruminococcus sp.]|nr:23S rRNA (adenine(2503)-C(2))-methyltransferase RlmN [Ruminococcus sp.]